MNKRTFLQALAGASMLPGAALAKQQPARAAGPALLTVSGDIGRPNRGALDPALDQLMHKHGVAFRKARTFDYAQLAALPATDIRPTIEYDGKAHTLRGPLLTRLLDLAGAQGGDGATVTMRAIDGYTVALALRELRERRFIAATHIDGAPLPLGGLGPLWAVFDADRVPELAAKTLPERFANCPWGLYSLHVGEAQG